MSSISGGGDVFDQGRTADPPVAVGSSGESSALITVCPDGPLLVRGSVRIVDTDGMVIPQARSTIALCWCGKSQIAPLCDGTHKLSRSRARAAEERRRDQAPERPDLTGRP